MSENEFDVQRDRAEEDRENVVLTGEEIELPGEDSDASAIIGSLKMYIKVFIYFHSSSL